MKNSTRGVAIRRSVRARSTFRTTGPRLSLVGLLLGAALVAGCAATPPPAPELPEDTSLTRVSDPEARRLLARGDALGAADIYTDRATRATDAAQREDYLLLAAEILFDRGLGALAQERLDAVPAEPSTALLMQRRDILVARSLLFSGDPEAALLALPDPVDVRSAIHRARVHETRAQVYHELDDPDNELVARIALERQLGDPLIIERSQQEIWQLLARQPLSTLRTMTTNVRDETYQGWVALALTGAAADEPTRRDELARWAALFPTHPANGDFLVALLDPDGAEGLERRFDSGAIEHVAVLLPLTASGAGAPAAAIRDGLIAAWTHTRTRAGVPVPTLRFHDIGENAAYARTAYEKALAEGADAVIGPLRKEAVAAIVTQRRIPVPTLTLNTVDTIDAVGRSDASRSNVVQFGLSPEDEARAAASRAVALSLTRAIVLQSDDSRGDREARAFRDELYAYGGDVMHVAVLPSDSYDYSAQIREALGIDQSDARFRRLSATIGERLFFEPAIRDDVDVVFLAITSEEARSARPQLDFFRARAIPRFATSRAASLADDEKINRDLDTIHYTDAPWVLDQSLADDPLRRAIVASFPSSEGAYAKLYALGVDAWTLMTNLDALADGTRLEGYTGDLELGRDGVIRRHPHWAQYRDGRSEPIERIEAAPLGEIRSGTTPN